MRSSTSMNAFIHEYERCFANYEKASRAAKGRRRRRRGWLAAADCDASLPSKCTRLRALSCWRATCFSIGFEYTLSTRGRPMTDENDNVAHLTLSLLRE